MSKPDNLIWKNDQPFSKQFDDVFFSTESGLDEAEFIFLKHNQLQQRFKTQKKITIAEVGFGFGLNFLMTLSHWQARANAPTGYCDYIGIEKYPPSPQALQRALAPWPHLKQPLQRLLQHYPPKMSGIIRLNWPDSQIRLTLLIGDIDWAMQNIVAQVDAWYFDGFSPAKNPRMWSTEVMQRAAALSHSKTTFATFSAAGLVKRNLTAAGFAVYKDKGFGKKRHLLYGHLEKPSNIKILPGYYSLPQHQDIKTIAVIGAGIAGCALAAALSERGFNVKLIDQYNQVCTQGSGVMMALLKPIIHQQISHYEQFHNSGYCYTKSMLNYLNQYSEEPLDQCIDTLIIHQPHDIKVNTTAHDFARRIDATQASEIAGIGLNQPALHIADTRLVNPKQLAIQIIQQYQDQITLIKNTKVNAIDFINHQPILSTCNNQRIQCDYVIIANANANPQSLHPDLNTFDLKQQAGQVSLFNTPKGLNLQCVLSYGGYAIPINNQLLLGSTYRPPGSAAAITTKDHTELIQKAIEATGFALHGLKQSQATDAFAAARCNTLDHLPLIGPIMDHNLFLNTYQRLRHGDQRYDYPAANYQPLALCTGFGSKGLTGAFLAAEHIASLLDSTPLPITQAMISATHPHRFWVKKLKQNL